VIHDEDVAAMDLVLQSLDKLDEILRARPVILMMPQFTQRILDGLFDLVARCDLKELAMLACDAVVFSESQPGLERLIEVSKNWWHPELQHQVLVAAIQFGRFPDCFQTLEIPEKPLVSFRSTQSHILRVGGGHMISNFPTGRYAWSVTPSLVTDDEEEALPEVDVENPRQPSDFELQSGFCRGAVENFAGLELAAVSDFERAPDVDSTIAADEPPTLTRKKKRTSTGNSTAAFVTSFGFSMPIENYTLYPSLHNGPINEPASTDVKLISVGFCAATPPPPLYEEFLSGLGFLHKDANRILYRHYRTRLLFNVDSHAGFQPVQIIWAEGLAGDDVRRTFSADTVLRIEVRQRPNGTFLVVAALQTRDAATGFLEQDIVTKAVLPLFVLAQIQSIVDLMEEMRRGDPIVKAGEALRAQIDANFLSNDVPFACEKALFTGRA
jgi:hypothetical protein